jgi:group I intron endonuclease
MKFIIYKIKNNKNGKLYIGQTKQSLQARFYRHLRRASNELHYTYALCNAIRKHGAESFECVEIETVNSLKEADEREVYWIELLNTLSPNGYNMTEGGKGTEGYKHTDEDKVLMSAMKQGMFVAENNPFHGKKHSKEQIEKWRKDRTGRLLTDEWKANISKTRTRKPVVNLDTGEVFESARHACRYYGKNPDSGTAGVIAKVCRKEKKYKTVMGFRFEYYDPKAHDNTVPSLELIKEGVTTIRKE